MSAVACGTRPVRRRAAAAVLASLGLTAVTLAQQAPAGREFPPGQLRALDELPASRLLTELQQRPAPVQARALQWLRSFHFTARDLPSLHADLSGAIFYVCQPDRPQEGEAAPSAPPAIGAAALPVDPFPASLRFHSRPGAPNVLYLNFSGETVANTEWNNVVGRAEIPAVAFSTDADVATYSDAEQVAIKRIWQRMAEDYAVFNIDVTTERPGTLSSRTAVALITRNTDANGDPNPHNSSGGVAYVNVFGSTAYAAHRPAWIYHNNLGNSEAYTAEAASHEIGHNMGLSHDGRTDGTEYYGGHGNGDISWGPLMGTGYNRNVSQWSKGEYYLANNTQDDLATIAAKVTYRTDDHGSTPGTATALIVTGGTNVVSTTPENDPANTNTANKGILERGSDADLFWLVTGNGPISLSVKPWIMAAGTRGGNVDIRAELHDEWGTLLLTNNPVSQTTVLIQTNLAEGRYYLLLGNSGAGDPFSPTPTGYTAYGSLGQYFISGYVTEAPGYVAPPVAELQVTDLLQSEQGRLPLTVTYSDDVAVDVATIDSNDLRITGPNGYDRTALWLGVDTPGDGTPRTATYAAEPPNGRVWSPADNGTYTVWMQTNQVSDTKGAWVVAKPLGQFRVAVPVALYFANMEVDPGWTLEPQWQYGIPSYPAGGGPTSGFTGSPILAYNLSGNYTDRLSTKYATSPPINCTGSSILTLRFQRWLRTRQNDTASIQVSTNGTAWLDVWASASAVSDTSWQEVQHALPVGVAGSPSVRLRWGLASNPTHNEIGWNIDDVELLGDGILDTTPPFPRISVADLTLGGSPSHACSVRFTDDTAVRLSSLDSTDLLVTGPHGYSNLVEFVGADLPTDGSPLTGSYSIAAPGATWDAADNGVYTVTLLEAAVVDTLNNATPQTILGVFNVALSVADAGRLEVGPADGLNASGTVGGPFNPASIFYTLTNSGGVALTWTASRAQAWVSLSAISGTLEAGASTSVGVSINTNATSLVAGSYTDTVTFVNTTSAAEQLPRAIALTVKDIGLQLARGESSAAGFPLILHGQPLHTYVIEATVDLVEWTAVVTNATGADGTFAYTDPASVLAPRLLYRARGER